MQSFILRHINSVVSVKSLQSIWYTHDVTDSTQALHLSLLLPLPSTLNCYTNSQPVSQSARCISSSCVLETGTDCLCRVAGWPRPRSHTKEALFGPGPAAPRAAAITQRKHPLHESLRTRTALRCWHLYVFHTAADLFAWVGFKRIPARILFTLE